MKKYFLLCCLTFLCIPFNYSQNNISINFGYGNFLYNSENSMKVMGDKNFTSHLAFGFDYTRNDVLGFNLMVAYDYSSRVEENTILFYRTAPDTPVAIASYGSDVSLVLHSIDLDYKNDLLEYLSFGIGPSLCFVNRIIEVSVPPAEGERKGNTIYDRLASVDLGGNVFVEFSYPLNDGEKYFFINSKLKMRYTHSFWFDEKGRNLDNYKQEFLDAQVSIGAGYSF